MKSIFWAGAFGSEPFGVRVRAFDSRGSNSNLTLPSLNARNALNGLPFFEISSATGQGIENLKFAMAERVLTPAEK